MFWDPNQAWRFSFRSWNSTRVRICFGGKKKDFGTALLTSSEQSGFLADVAPVLPAPPCFSHVFK